MTDFNKIKKRVDDLVRTIDQRSNGVVRVEDAAEELEREVLPALYKYVSDLEKVCNDHKNISTCVNQYRFIKANKYMFNSEQREVMYEELVDKLLECVR